MAKGLAEAWEAAGVRYAVANGLEEYPEKVGRDLDVVVAPADLARAVTVTLEYCQTRGITAVLNRLGWVYWVMISRRTEQGVESLQVDLFDHLQWEFSWVLDGDHLDDRKRVGAFWVDPWSHMAKRLLIHLLSTGGKVFSKKPQYLEADATEREALAAGLPRITGRDWPELLAALERRDAAAVVAEAGALRKAVRCQSFRADNFGRRVWSAWQKQWAVNVRPRRGAPVIALHCRAGAHGAAVFAAFEAVFRRGYVYCGVKVIDGAGSDGLVQAWREELQTLRRASALQVVHLLKNHVIGRALFSGAPPAGLLRLHPSPDLSVVLAENADDARAAEAFCGPGLVDEVIRAGGDVETDTAAVMEAVAAWHEARAERNALMWRNKTL